MKFACAALLACGLGVSLTACGTQPATADGTSLAARVSAACVDQRVISVAAITGEASPVTSSVLVVCRDDTTVEVPR